MLAEIEIDNAFRGAPDDTEMGELDAVAVVVVNIDVGGILIDLPAWYSTEMSELALVGTTDTNAEAV